MKILTKTIYAILGAAVYTSSVYAMPFQLDLSSRWGQTASSLKFDFGGIEALSVSSIFITDEEKENATTVATVTHSDSSRSYKHLFSESGNPVAERTVNVASGENISDTGVQAAGNNLISEIDGSIAYLIDDNGNVLSNSSVQQPGTASVMAHKNVRQTSGSFKFVIGKQTRDEPDLSSVWLIGLVLGLGGITWRLVTLIRESNDL